MIVLFVWNALANFCPEEFQCMYRKYRRLTKLFFQELALGRQYSSSRQPGSVLVPDCYLLECTDYLTQSFCFLLSILDISLYGT